MTERDQAIAKIRHELDWRGPTGKTMGHVVMERKLAEALLKWIDEQPCPKNPG